MATRSAAKAHRQYLKRRLRNKAVRSAVKTAIKRADAAIASGDLDAARLAVRSAISVIDRAAKKGVIHPNSAARRKSRLVLKFNAAVAALQPAAEPDQGAVEPPQTERSQKGTSRRRKTKEQ